MQLTHKAGFALTLLPLCGLAASQPAVAQINGFGNGSGFTLNTNGNGSPSISGGTFQVTTSAPNEAASTFYDTKQNITSFTADFTYEDVTGGGDDGFAFVLQNAGVNALGQGGGGLGYTNISPSASLDHDIYFYSGIQFTTDGAQPSGYQNTRGPGGQVNLPEASPVNIHVSYDGSTLTEAMTQGSNSFSTSYAVNLGSVLGANTAYVGFTGAAGDGGFRTTQDISNFNFTPNGNGSPAPEPSSLAVLALTALGLGGVLASARRKKAQAGE